MPHCHAAFPLLDILWLADFVINKFLLLNLLNIVHTPTYFYLSRFWLVN